MKFVFLLLLLAAIIITGCFTPPPSPIFPVVVAPEHVRLKATILSIDSTLIHNSSDGGPCSKAPCMAVVRVDSVEGFGRGAQPLLSGDKIKVQFALTMNPVTNAEDTLQSLPGLTINDTFRAEVEGKKDEKIFIVQKYLKQKNQ